MVPLASASVPLVTASVIRKKQVENITHAGARNRRLDEVNPFAFQINL